MSLDRENVLQNFRVDRNIKNISDVTLKICPTLRTIQEREAAKMMGTSQQQIHLWEGGGGGSFST